MPNLDTVTNFSVAGFSAGRAVSLLAAKGLGDAVSALTSKYVPGELGSLAPIVPHLALAYLVRQRFMVNLLGPETAEIFHIAFLASAIDATLHVSDYVQTAVASVGGVATGGGSSRGVAALPNPQNTRQFYSTAESKIAAALSS